MESKVNDGDTDNKVTEYVNWCKGRAVDEVDHPMHWVQCSSGRGVKQCKVFM